MTAQNQSQDPNYMVVGYYVPQTYLEHAEYMHMSNNPHDIYNINCDLFEAYLDTEDEAGLGSSLMYKFPIQSLINLALLMAAVHGEI